jgi:hypothetical protein|uniref:Uncharacterized protein n=1 Tax=Populus trichocarpa TaxID=3694 RepID=U5G129_POPTR
MGPTSISDSHDRRLKVAITTISATSAHKESNQPSFSLYQTKETNPLKPRTQLPSHHQRTEPIKLNPTILVTTQ